MDTFRKAVSFHLVAYAVALYRLFFLQQRPITNNHPDSPQEVSLALPKNTLEEQRSVAAVLGVIHWTADVVFWYELLFLSHSLDVVSKLPAQHHEVSLELTHQQFLLKIGSRRSVTERESFSKARGLWKARTFEKVSPQKSRKKPSGPH